MKSPARIVFRLLIIITLTYFTQEIYAGTSPPDPGGSPTGGGPPVGGGAPIGNGAIFLIISALTYAMVKVRGLRLSKRSAE